MNEPFWRIFELAKQADLIQWDSLPSGARTPDHESVVKARKFAELIIKDCIEAIQNESMALNVDEFEHGLRIAKGAILDHFGVEE